MSEPAFDPEACDDYESGQLFENQVLTVKDAAKFLRFSQKTIYRLVGTGEIPHKRIGSEIRFFLPELLDWMKGV